MVEPHTSNQLHRLKDLIDRADAHLRAAHQLIQEITGEDDGGKKRSYQDLVSELHSTTFENQQIIEGIYDGQNMIGPNEKAYPVPANYASKSKLIQGDKLKLTILPDGKFLYKQIGPAERKHIKGILSYENGQYAVLAEGKSYHVLLASVTYFKASVGDEVTLVVPAELESEWGAIENIIPKPEA